MLPAAPRSRTILWTRDRCTRRVDIETHEEYWLKDPSEVKRAAHDLRRVLVVADSPRDLERRYGNVVAVRRFTGDPDDRELPALTDHLASLAGRSTCGCESSCHVGWGLRGRIAWS